MRRMLPALAMCVLPLVAHAQAPKQTPKNDLKKASDVRPIPTTIPLGEAKPASFVHAPPAPPVAPQPLPTMTATPTTMPAITSTRVGPVSFGDRLMAAWDVHNCAPDGCPKPIGCGNFWTEKKFIFGSCRQFFGYAESSVGHHHKSFVP